jgi:hypothetical protein
MPMMVVAKPTRMSDRCWYRRASRPAASEDSKSPTVAEVNMTPVWTALYLRITCRKADTTNETPMSMAHCTF